MAAKASKEELEMIHAIHGAILRMRNHSTRQSTTLHVSTPQWQTFIKMAKKKQDDKSDEINYPGVRFHDNERITLDGVELLPVGLKQSA